jgi:hypothetical protein
MSDDPTLVSFKSTELSPNFPNLGPLNYVPITVAAGSKA